LDVQHCGVGSSANIKFNSSFDGKNQSLKPFKLYLAAYAAAVALPHCAFMAVVLALPVPIAVPVIT
jgi:hypothetical protein